MNSAFDHQHSFTSLTRQRGPRAAANWSTSTARKCKRALRVSVVLMLIGCQSPASPRPSSAPTLSPVTQSTTSGGVASGGTAAVASTHTPLANLAGANATGPSNQSSQFTCPERKQPSEPEPGSACGPLDCRKFERVESALDYVLRETSPIILAVGEIHAQKGSGLKQSPTARFGQLLPELCGKAKHIVIELWTPRNDCGDERVETVRRAQQPVTQAQAGTNQNDFLELGNVAKRYGIQPHALTPSCDDFQTIVAAKDQDILRMLELTATKTAELAEDLLRRTERTTARPPLILYGGAMHNDLDPAPGREALSYGPRLAKFTHDRITELDIVLREQVRNAEAFTRLPWYPHFRKETLEKHFVVYRLGPRSMTLIYPTQENLP